MEMTINGNADLEKSGSKSNYWNDSLIQDFYVDYYKNLNSKELDEEFNQDLRTLTNVLGKLSESERKTFIELFSKFLEFYIENKIEKEIELSLFKILKF